MRVVLLLALCESAAHCSTPNAEILRIQSEIQAGNLDTATFTIEAALRENPQDGGLYNLRGIVHADQNELRAAEKDFEKAVQLSPRLAPAYLNLGRVCEMLSESEPVALDRAIVQYRKLLSLDPGSHPVRLQLSKLLAERGKYDASLQELAHLPAGDRASVLAVSLRCGDLTGLGRSAEAEAVAQTLAETPELDEQVVAAVLPALLKSRTDSIVIHLLSNLNQREQLSSANLQVLAAAYERSGQFAAARQTLEKVVPQSSTDPAPLMELARVAQKQNDLNGALGYLAHARDLKPDYAPVHFFFGVVCIELDLPVEAKKSLQKALDLDPDNAMYNYARGSVELQGRSAWEAIPYFRKFVAAQPQDKRGHFALGVAEFASHDYESAAKEMQSVANVKETGAGAEYFLGRIAKAEGDWSGASEHFRKSIAAGPGYADSHAELGLAAMHLDDLTGARKELDQALALNPNGYLANANLLALLKRTKDPLAGAQEEKLRRLDLSRSEKQNLMLRTIEISRYAY